MSTESSNTNAESSNIGRRSLTLLFLIMRREREDQLAESTESTQLQETLHSLQQSAAQFGMRRKRGSKEEIYRRSRGSGVEHDKIRRRKEIDHATMSTARSAEEKDRPSDDDHDLPEDRRSTVHDKHDLPKGRTIIDT